MTQRLDKKENDEVRGPSSKLVTNGPEAQNKKIKISTVARTKLGVYNMDIIYLSRRGVIKHLTNKIKYNETIVIKFI